MRFSVLFAVPAIVLSTAATMGAQSASSAFQISTKTEVPGASLSPGSYTVRIADHLNDRLIVQVQKAGGHDLTTLLAYPNASLSSSGAGGPVLFNSGLKSKPTLRGFAFAGGPTVEFVYPKKDAVTLAKANDVKVMAVDPASEGRPKLPQLTSSDMNEVTLWMLTPTTVQPGAEPGIQAARYQPPTSTSTSTQLASAPVQPAYHPVSPSATPEAAPAQPVQVASNTRPHIRPAVKQLPHTASNLPVIALLGLLSFGVAGGLGTKRRMQLATRKQRT